MEKKLIMLGVIDEEGFDITNRLYDMGGVFTYFNITRCKDSKEI